MLVGDLLKKSQKDQLRTEMEVFLAFLMDCSRLDLTAHPEWLVPVEHLSTLQKGWTQLLDGTPVAYLTNEKEFYGISLYVDERVLVPRPETELLVDYVLKRCEVLKGSGVDPVRVLEIGTGSGAIAIALKKTDPSIEVTATEVSSEALDVAKKNADEQGLEIDLIESDLLEGVPEQEFHYLVANLPYIGTESNNYLSENVEKHEPNVALFGGSDGLELYRKMFIQITEQSRDFKAILGELGFTQGEGMKNLAADELPDYNCEIKQDYQGLDRHFILEKKV